MKSYTLEELNLSLDQKIEHRLDKLEAFFKANKHLDESTNSEASILIFSVSKFWSRLNDEQRDFIHGVRYMLEERSEWK